MTVIERGDAEFGPIKSGYLGHFGPFWGSGDQI